MPKSRPFSVALCALVVLFAPRASAQQVRARAGGEAPFPIGFERERGPGAESCVGEDALRRSAETLLQRRTFAPRDQTAVVIHGRVVPSRGAQRFLAHLTLVAGDGSV